MGSTLCRHIRMVVPTQVIRSALQWVMADPPTPLRVAVGLTDTRVHPDADRNDECRLTQVGTEAGPEAVVGTALIEGPGVNGRPMAQEGKEDDQ